ncbi:MAG: dNTP triphosphohydrolase [Muribaculaceae bacterium]|nr:dNTP triphosphohydrolase [Muribaculaceae bacterium]
MSWEKLISSKRLGLEEYHDPKSRSRSDFQRDYDRMIFSSPFRRLQNKTQVFPLPGHIFVHNRLTHSLEVSSVGRSMANAVAEELQHKYRDEGWSTLLHHVGDITATACLCHDMGNPPFGHSGEKAISTFFSEREGMYLKDMLTPREWNDFTHFEGNANSLRLLTHQFAGRRPGGFAMTYSALASIVKYPYDSMQAYNPGGKFGFFNSELDTYSKIAAELGIPAMDAAATRFMRHPLVYIVEAADDICYQIMDIEDAHKLKILSHEDTISLLMGFIEPSEVPHCHANMSRVTDPNEQVAYLRSTAIGILSESCARTFIDNEELILKGDLKGSLISNLADSHISKAYTDCTKAAYAYIYAAPEVVDVELAGHRIINYLLQRLIEAVMRPDDYASRLLLSKVPSQYNTKAPTLYGRIQSVLDHVSAMTDVYALDLFRKLNGSSLPAV